MKLERIVLLVGLVATVFGAWWALGDRIVYLDNLKANPPWAAIDPDLRQWVKEQDDAHVGRGHDVTSDISGALSGPQAQIEALAGRVERISGYLDTLEDRVGQADVRIGAADVRIGSVGEELDRFENQVDEISDDLDKLGEELDTLEGDFNRLARQPWNRQPMGPVN